MACCSERYGRAPCFAGMYVTLSIKIYHYQILFKGEVIADIYKETGRRGHWHVLDRATGSIAVTGCRSVGDAIDEYFEWVYA